MSSSSNKSEHSPNKSDTSEPSKFIGAMTSGGFFWEILDDTSLSKKSDTVSIELCRCESLDNGSEEPLCSCCEEPLCSDCEESLCSSGEETLGSGCEETLGSGCEEPLCSGCGEPGSGCEGWKFGEFEREESICNGWEEEGPSIAGSRFLYRPAPIGINSGFESSEETP